MALVKVYRFKRYDINTDQTLLAPRAATLDTIIKCRGEAIMSTEEEVDEKALDGDGFVNHNPTANQANDRSA